MPNQLKKNDRIPLKITGVTAEGSGVGHDNGLAVFVANAALGDTVTAHIIKVKKNYAVARIHQIVTPSPDRVKPDCPVFQQCGGCAWRHITYEAECRLKEKTVADALSRIGHLTITPRPILAAGETDGYRNKAQFPVSCIFIISPLFFIKDLCRPIYSCFRCLSIIKKMNKIEIIMRIEKEIEILV